MKKVVVFGAAGHTGKYITRKMQSMQDVLLCSLEGDVLTMAKNIVAALPIT